MGKKARRFARGGVPSFARSAPSRTRVRRPARDRARATVRGTAPGARPRVGRPPPRASAAAAPREARERRARTRPRTRPAPRRRPSIRSGCPNLRRARTTSRPDPEPRAARRPSTRRDRDRAPRSEVLASRFAPRGTRASREHSDAARVNAVERRFGLGAEFILAASDASLIPALLGDADPYVVTRWFEQRFINLDRGSKLPLGSLAPACDPSGSEGVGTGEFADRTIVAYRSRLRLKVVVPSGSSRRGGVVGDDEARTASGGKPSSAKSPPLSVKG